MLKLLRFLKVSAVLCAIIAPLMMVLDVSMDLLQPTLVANIIAVVGPTGSGKTTIISLT